MSPVHLLVLLNAVVYHMHHFTAPFQRTHVTMQWYEVYFCLILCFYLLLLNANSTNNSIKFICMLGWVVNCNLPDNSFTADSWNWKFNWTFFQYKMANFGSIQHQFQTKLIIEGLQTFWTRLCKQQYDNSSTAFHSYFCFLLPTSCSLLETNTSNHQWTSLQARKDKGMWKLKLVHHLSKVPRNPWL